MWNSIVDSFNYVMSDNYFIPSMAVVVMIGVFIGSVIYDGCLQDIKKMFISLFAYAFMIIAVTSERVVPSFFDGVFRTHHPFSGIATVLLITIFYGLGMILGVYITNFAHKDKKTIKRLKF